MFNIYASQISDNIDIDSFQKAYKAELLQSSFYELFYEIDMEVYVSVFRYGVVCFFNFNESRINDFTHVISNYCNYFYDSELIKHYKVITDTDDPEFGYHHMKIPYIDIETIRLIMFNVARSVALDSYYQTAKAIMDRTSKFTLLLEKRGKMTMSDRDLKRFVGKAHNLKNQIIENLQLLDSFTNSSMNDYLLRLEYGMKEALFIENRSKSVYEELGIIKEHLEFFNDIMTHNSNLKLSWIIIVLLIVFVIDIIIERFF